MAGRRLAKAFSPDRMASRPRSGLWVAGKVSHLYLCNSIHPIGAIHVISASMRSMCLMTSQPYPPMADSSTASEAFAVARVLSGSGTPVASIAAPPINS